MAEERTVLRKSIPLETLRPLLSRAESVDYWRSLQRHLEISDEPFRGIPAASGPPGENDSYAAQLREEGYFQTGPLIPVALQESMRGAVEAVQAAGFPPMFALVYDVFFEAFAHFDGILTGILGRGYQLIPNFWVYHIGTSDQAKGFEPHRDAEYAETIGPDGIPTVLTLWVAVTDATPLNSCMYVVPRNRDPQYADAIRNLVTQATHFRLEDIRALPARAGTLSCWDQYIYHWGSRGSSRAPHARISYATYCQRGDIPPVSDRIVPLPSPFDFRKRLSLICRGLYRYSYVQLQQSEESGEVRAFLEKHM